MLQWLQSDPLLQNISHLIMDEIHERDINSDFLITIIKDILPLRPDLKVGRYCSGYRVNYFPDYLLSGTARMA